MKMRKFRDKHLQKFWDKLHAATQKEYKSWTSYDSGFSYGGLINDDPDQPVFVLWHAANLSYSYLEKRALLQHYYNAFDKIKGLEWNREWARGNGGAEWIVINVTDSTTAALREVYEQFGDIWGADEADFYFAQDTPEYEEMYEEESRRDFITWWEDNVPKPFGELPEKYYTYHDSLNWHSGDCYAWNQHHDDVTKEQFIMQQVLKALNAGDIEVDKEEYEEWYIEVGQEHYKKWHEAHEKGWWQKYKSDANPWPEIAQGSDGTWGLASELVYINDGEWDFPVKRDPDRQRKLFDDAE